MQMTDETPAPAEGLRGDELTVRELVALRLMLDDALRRGRTAGRYSRGSAVVALDATVERVTYLVAQSRGLSLASRATLTDVYSKVKQDLADVWEPQVWPLINKLHLERNKVQHQSLEPDRDQLPSWVQAVESYVVSLVRVEYNIDIRRVVLADAIEDPELSTLIRNAGDELEAGEIEASVELAFTAFDTAVDRWIRMQANPYRPPLARHVSGVGRVGGPDHQDAEIKALRRTAAQATFASSPSDHEWFRAATRERSSKLLDADDAERILVFVFSWIASFTVAEREWVTDRRHRASVAARRVRRSETVATVAEVQSVVLRWDDDYTVVFGLRDVPREADFDLWSQALEQLLNTDEREGVRWAVNLDGTVNLSTRAGVVPRADDLATLAGAVARADQDAGERARAEEERTQMLQAEAERREAELATVRGQLPSWVESIWWGEPDHPPAQGGSWRFAVRDVRAMRRNDHAGRSTTSLHDTVGNIIRDHELVDECFGIGSSNVLAVVPPVDVADLVEILSSANDAAGAMIAEAELYRERHDRVVADVTADLAGSLSRLSN